MDNENAFANALKNSDMTMSDIAKKLKVTKQAVQRWSSAGEYVPAKHCLDIEEIFRGEITRQQMRPNDWQKYWRALPWDKV